MDLTSIRIAKSALTDNVYAGFLDKDQISWLEKVDITNDFLKAVIERWAGFGQILNSSYGKSYYITVKEVDNAKPKPPNP